MKIIEKNFEDENIKKLDDGFYELKKCCGDQNLFKLDGWDEDDWMCADCLLRELINNNYTLLPENINGVTICIKCGDDKNVHFRESMEYVCDKCIKESVENAKVSKV